MMQSDLPEDLILGRQDRLQSRFSIGHEKSHLQISPFRFIASCLTFSLGLANIWRFPYLCYKNGGGTFLVPYVLMLFIVGLPLFFLEMVLGQYMSMGANSIFNNMAPIFNGVGYAALSITFFINIYYSILSAWSLNFMYAAIDYEVAWSSCDNDFNSVDCFNTRSNADCKNQSLIENVTLSFWNHTCYLVDELCKKKEGYEDFQAVNFTHCRNSSNYVTSLQTILPRVMSSEEYFQQSLLGLGDSDWDSFGKVQVQIILSNCAMWFLVTVCIVKGLNTAFKMNYFVSTVFPLVVIVLSVLQAITLEGSSVGIRYYLRAKWEDLARLSLWADAASQVFFTLSVSCGSLFLHSSYNKFHNNCHRDAIFVALFSGFTSMISAIAVFGTSGFIANELGASVDTVVEEKVAFPYVAYSETVLHRSNPNFWTFVIYLMLLILGINSQCPGVDAVVTAFIDIRGNFRTQKNYILVGIAILCFLLGIPMCCQGGIYMITLIDWNTLSWNMLFIGCLEFIVAAWIYGEENIFLDINEMGMEISGVTRNYWYYTWKYISPLTLMAVVIMNFIDFRPASYGDYIFPKWVDVVGWLVAWSTLMPIPVFFIYNGIRSKQEGLGFFESEILQINKERMKRKPVAKMDEGHEIQRAFLDIFSLTPITIVLKEDNDEDSYDGIF